MYSLYVDDTVVLAGVLIFKLNFCFITNVCLWNLDASQYVDRLYEEWRNIRGGQGGKKYNTYRKKKEGSLHRSHHAEQERSKISS